jgi:3-methyladenine DNA glycosylase AlkD
VGWMRREVGKRVDQQILTDFLDLHSSEMPRTMLRYAIEKLSSDQKQYYLAMRASSR